jgi:hypothetical protein
MQFKKKTTHLYGLAMEMMTDFRKKILFLMSKSYISK